MSRNLETVSDLTKRESTKLKELQIVSQIIVNNNVSNFRNSVTSGRDRQTEIERENLY